MLDTIVTIIILVIVALNSLVAFISLWDHHGDIELVALPFLILGFPGTILAIICGETKRKQQQEQERKRDEEEKQRKREAYERCARTLSQDPAFIHGCAQRMESHIRQCIQYGRVKPLKQAATEIEFVLCGSYIAFRCKYDFGIDFDIQYSDFGYESLSRDMEIAFAHLMKVELRKRLPTIPIATRMVSWHYDEYNPGIVVDISKEVRLLKTL